MDENNETNAPTNPDYKVPERYKITRQRFTRFFTWTYWRFQLAALLTGKTGLNVVETFEVELPDKIQ